MDRNDKAAFPNRAAQDDNLLFIYLIISKYCDLDEVIEGLETKHTYTLKKTNN